jgi:RNA polymerase sigma factor (sigma-70 family)
LANAAIGCYFTNGFRSHVTGPTVMADNQPAVTLTELLTRVRAGDEPALAELLRLYEPHLRAEARVLLGPLLRPYLDSVDLVQTVHGAILPGLRDGTFQFTEPRQLVALAVTILRHKAAKSWRKNRRFRPAAAGADREVIAASLAENPALAAESNDLLARVLQSLSSADRELLGLVSEGWTPAAIADRLGCDPHLIRSRLSKLRLRLRASGLIDPV